MIIKEHIDQYLEGISKDIDKFESEFGPIDEHITKSKCIKCDKEFEDGSLGMILYVVVGGNKVLWWHIEH